MSSHLNHRVIVEDATCAGCSVHTKRVHHRGFPEISAECDSIAEAVSHLIVQLKRTRENTQGNWHRGLVDQAISEAAEFLDTLTEDGRDPDGLCRCDADVPESIESSLP